MQLAIRVDVDTSIGLREGVPRLLDLFRRRSVRASFFAPPTFDVSLREIFVPLLAGGTLVIPDPEVRSDARRLVGWLREQRI